MRRLQDGLPTLLQHVQRKRTGVELKPAAAALAAAAELASEGVVEVTLLGQTVNAYGRPRPGRAPGEVSFSELIRRLAEVDGIERIRFTSPHPLFMTQALEACYGEVRELCPHLHLPRASARILRHDDAAQLYTPGRGGAAGNHSLEQGEGPDLRDSHYRALFSLPDHRILSTGRCSHYQIFEFSLLDAVLTT